MNKNYDSTSLENKWYQRWEDSGAFKPHGDGKPYCIVLPPPNVTGSLHMGHAFQDTLMDILIRYHRMKGQQTLWQVGTDHAGIATQMVVERQCLAKGINRHELGREKFVEKIWEWKDTSGGNIIQQMRRLGASADWERERFTMDDGLSAAVSDVFIQLFNEGLIYRGKRLVNWDPTLKTAVSDLEVVSEDEAGKLVHINYPLEDGTGFITIATTRPETIFGDVAIAVHPEDERYKKLIGSNCLVPIQNRAIPIIADDAVIIEFGTGCVKVTPAHDFTDYDIGKRHKLQQLNILTDDACLNSNCPTDYIGLDRFDARKKVLDDLESLGAIHKIEDYQVKIPRGDRTGVILEPYLTNQWFVKIAPLAEPAINAVKLGKIEFVPKNWENTYFEWMNNIQDWCISRQLWWGHRIPAWYDQKGTPYVGKDEKTVREKHGLGPNVQLTQDEDVLDTWFSSALWPYSTLGWPEKTAEFEKFYPTNVLVTGFDIIFFWVARMIMFGLKFGQDIPFEKVYVHGLIQDAHGQKMSKSKGNVIDPIDLIDGIELEPLVQKRLQGLMQPQMAKKIEKSTRKDYPEGIPAFGVDAVRFTFCALASNTRQIRFDLNRVEGYRNFVNKLWNAARFVQMQFPDGHKCNKPATESFSLPDKWIFSKLHTIVNECSRHIAQYRFDLLAQTLYEFTWHDFCDWYLELSKPVLQSQSTTADQKQATLYTLLTVLDTICEQLHPIVPYITEEISESLNQYKSQPAKMLIERKALTANQIPNDKPASEKVEFLKKAIEGIRNIRGELNISPSKPISVLVRGNEVDTTLVFELEETFCHLAKINSLQLAGTSLPPSATSMAGNLELFVPLEGIVDVSKELERASKEQDRLNGEIARLEAKLSNERFVSKAPKEVVNEAKAKQQQYTAQLQKLDNVIQDLQSINKPAAI